MASTRWREPSRDQLLPVGGGGPRAGTVSWGKRFRRKSDLTPSRWRNQPGVRHIYDATVRTVVAELCCDIRHSILCGEADGRKSTDDLNRGRSEVIGYQRPEHSELGRGRVAADLRRRRIPNSPEGERLSEISCTGLEIVRVGTGPPWRALDTARLEPFITITRDEVRDIDRVSQFMGEDSGDRLRCVTAADIDLDNLVVRKRQATKRRVGAAVTNLPTRQRVVPLERKQRFGSCTELDRSLREVAAGLRGPLPTATPRGGAADHLSEVG